jgi:hypothetical protein
MYHGLGGEQSACHSLGVQLTISGSMHKACRKGQFLGMRRLRLSILSHASSARMHETD